MKLRLWIALALALALTATLTLTAFAEEMIPADGAEDALIIEDALTEGEAELDLDEAFELLPSDIALKEEITDMPPATDAEAANNTEANGSVEVKLWDELVKALESAQNGDTIIISRDISQESFYSASIRSKSITMILQNQNQIKGKKN